MIPSCRGWSEGVREVRGTNQIDKARGKEGESNSSFKARRREEV